MENNVIVGGKTDCTCLNQNNNRVALPAEYLYRSLQDGRILHSYDGTPLQIDRCDNAELVEVTTNYPKYQKSERGMVSSHSFIIGRNAMLQLWDGGVVVAHKAKGQRLVGERGMYVVRNIKKCNDVIAYAGNFLIVGTVYVEGTKITWPTA